MSQLFSNFSNLPVTVLDEFTYYYSFNSHSNIVIIIYSHFVDEAAEAQRGGVTYPRSHRYNRSWD